LSPARPPGAGADSADPTLADRVRRTVADVLGLEQEQVTLESSSETLESWDSIKHLNLVLALETEFGVSVGPEEVEGLGSVAAIVRRLEATLGRPGSAPPTAEVSSP